MNIAELESPYCYYAFAIEALAGADHLHYGLWGPEVADVKMAQENLAKLMTSLIPDGVRRILDAGCGLGATAFQLATAGYTVTGISPDANNMNLAKARFQHDNLQLLTTDFEGYTNNQHFDLILFQESSQYISLSKLLDRSLDLLNDLGYLLICDEVRYRDGPGLAFHNRNTLIDAAKERSLLLRKNQNITEQALPTRHFLVGRLKREWSSLVEAFRGYRPNVESELNELIQGWEAGTHLFEHGVYGYEVFLFEKNSETRVR